MYRFLLGALSGWMVFHPDGQKAAGYLGRMATEAAKRGVKVVLSEIMDGPKQTGGQFHA